MVFREYPGYIGVHSREQAPGAMPNGTRVIKVAGEPSDTHPIGARATVLGSVSTPANLAYFVEWDASPRHAVLVIAWKIQSRR